MRKVLILALIVAVALIGLKFYADYRAERTLKDFLERLGIEDRTNYRSVSYFLTTGEVRVSGINIRTSEGNTTVRELILKRITESDLEFYLKGIEGEDEEFKRFKRDLLDLGYKNPAINAHIDLSFYRDRRELFVRDISVEIPGALSMGVELKIEGLDSKILELLRESDPNNREDMAKIANELQKMSLKNLEITFRDFGFIKRAINREAKRKEKKPDELRKELITRVEKSISSKGEFERSLKNALKNLIRDGGSLKLVSNKSIRFDDLVVLILSSLQSKDLTPLAKGLDLKVYYSKE